MDPRSTPPAGTAAMPPRSRKRLALGSAVIVTTALIGVPVVNAVASTGADTKVLTNVIPGLAKLRDLGTVAADKPMVIGVAIPGNTAARNAAYAAMTTPGSASYGSAYTPTSFAAAFGVSAEVSQAVVSWATAKGLTSVYDARDGSYLELTGTAAQVEKTLNVSVHNYSVGGKTYYASTTGATVPSTVGTVLGLSDFDQAHVNSSQDICEAGMCTGTTAPPALWGNYDQPDTYKEGAALSPTEDYGQGQKVAIFGEGDLVQVVKDLRLFEDDTSVGGDVKDLKPKLPHIPVAETLVNDPQTDVSGLGEWDLDSQSSTGMSPDLSQLQFYFGSDLSDASIAATYSAWVNDANGAMIGNSSFGGCETLNLALGGASVDDGLLQQAAMMKRTMFVSTGDTGSGGCVPVLPINGVGNGGAPIVEYPASSPYVVGVGGTTAYTAASTAGVQTQPPVRALEDTWDDSGGGLSEFEPQPKTQAALGGTLPPFAPCVADSTGSPVVGVTCRSIPDISAQSGDIATNNYGIESAGAQTAEAGTSLSSPLMAGMWARVRAAHSATGCTSPTPALAQASLTKAGLTTVAESTLSDIGFAQQALYDIAEKSAADDVAAFFDIGGTTNSQPGMSLATGNGAYTPLPRNATLDPTGFDFTSGLGAPDISKLTLILDCSTTPTSTAIPNSDAITFPPVATGSCAPNGTLTDPMGDETPTDSALDIVSVKDTSDSSQVTLTMTLAGLPESNASQENDYDAYFTYGSAVYYAEADNGNLGGTAPTFMLYSQTTNATTGQYTNTALGTISGSFTDATGVVSLGFTYAQFNSFAKPKTALAAGAVFSALSDDTTTVSTGQVTDSDVASFGNCTYTLTGDVTTGPASPPASSPPPSSSAPMPGGNPTGSPSPSSTPTSSSANPTASPISTATPLPTSSSTPPTRFHPLSYRPLNSRTVVNGHDEAAKVVGVAGVPATNVVDVLLQVTVDQATANVPVLVDSDFGTAPAQQAAVAVKGTTTRNVVLVTPDSRGLVGIAMTRGAARIALAVIGYDSLGAGDGFHPTFGGRVSATLTKVTTSRKPLAVVIGGKGGVPAGSLDAALLDARVDSVSLPKNVKSATLYATVGGTSRRTAIATLTATGTQTALVVARPDSHGKVTFSLSAGSAKIVVNQSGAWATTSYTATHADTASLRFGHPMAALPEFDGTLGTGTKTLTLQGLPPTGASTVVLQVSVASGPGAGEVVLATTGARFGDGSVSFAPGTGAGQLVSVAPDAFGRVSLRLSKGSRKIHLALVGFTALS